MLPQLLEGDMMRKAVREAFLLNRGILAVPASATAFLENTTATSALVQGYILDDGGATITARGIAWATFYNPEISDNISIPGAESNNFTVTLPDLIPGLTYYARTFATNSEGTGYGNCIDFVASAPVGTSDIDAPDNNLTIHPNPASGLTTFVFHLETVENITLYIINIKGQIVLKYETGTLNEGENHVGINLSGLPDGIYNCVIKNGTINATGKLVIERE